MAATNIFTVPGRLSPTDTPAVTSDTDWLLVTVLKISSGTMVMGTQPDAIVGSPYGIDLPVDVMVPLLLAPGSKLYFAAADAAQQAAVMVQPITGLLSAFITSLKPALVEVGQTLIDQFLADQSPSEEPIKVPSCNEGSSKVAWMQKMPIKKAGY